MTEPKSPDGSWINAILNGAESDVHLPGAVDLARAELATLRDKEATLDKLVRITGSCLRCDPLVLGVLDAS